MPPSNLCRPRPPRHGRHVTSVAPTPVAPPRECLAAHTTVGLGGPAADWRHCRSLQHLINAVRHSKGRPLLVLGGGSNLVCADGEFEGTVLAMATRGIHISLARPAAGVSKLPLSHGSPNVTSGGEAPPQLDHAAAGADVWVHVAAGETWDAIVEACCAWDLAGVECLSGIPGKAGATPIQNVGAYGQELSDCLWGVTCLRRETGELVYFPADECDLGYRHSRFKTQSRDEYVVVEVVLRLRRGGMPNVTYAEIARQFAAEPTPSLMAVRQAVLATRRAKSLLFDRSDPNSRNCGSFFVNPTVNNGHYLALQTRYNHAVPGYAVGQDRTKIPAAWLIERAGFVKGERCGNVGLSTKHTLCLVAHDGATAADLVGFARVIRDRVRAEFEIELVPEPVLVGMTW